MPVAIEITDPRRAYYIFGPENGSLSKEIMNKCKYTVKIPTNGCLNLGAAVNVVLYDRLAKLKREEEGEEGNG